MTYHDLLLWAGSQPDARLSDADLLAIQWHLEKKEGKFAIIAERLLIDLLRERAAKCTST